MDHIINKWDLRYLHMAQLVSTWSKDPSTKTGAVFVDSENRVISVGFNGLPRGEEDDYEILNNRKRKYQHIIHCEENAILFADRERLKGSTLYTWPFMSCVKCMNRNIQVGCIRHVAPYDDNPRWVDSFKETRELCKKYNVELLEVNLKNFGF